MLVCACYIHRFFSFVIVHLCSFYSFNRFAWASTKELEGVSGCTQPDGEAAVDDFFVGGVILVERQESGSTPVLKTADSSLVEYLKREVREAVRARWRFQFEELKALVTKTSLMKFSGAGDLGVLTAHEASPSFSGSPVGIIN